MLTRIMAALTGLLSFAVVCFTGLMRGHSFDSVIRGSLIALGVGAVAGALVALVVRAVVAESFKQQQSREQDASGSTLPVAPGQTPPRPAGQDRAAEAAPATAPVAARPKK